MRNDVGDDAAKQLILADKVSIDGGLRDVCLRSDLIHTGARKAATEEDTQGGLDDDGALGSAARRLLALCIRVLSWCIVHLRLHAPFSRAKRGDLALLTRMMYSCPCTIVL